LLNELNLNSKTIKLELWVKIHWKEFVFLCYFIWTSWILVTRMSSDTLYVETLNMACIQLITEWLRLKLTGGEGWANCICLLKMNNMSTYGLWQCRIVCYLQGIDLFCIYNAASWYIDSLYAFLYFQDSIFVINVFFLMYLGCSHWVS
jgi:hypothetical protein